MKNPSDDLEKTPTGAQALTRGLEVLRVLAESAEPLSSQEIARRVGLHQSWVSRILKTLTRAGYVRKPSYHSFGIDYGVLCLGGIAARQFKLTTRPLDSLRQLLTVLQDNDAEISLGCIWDKQVIYFFRLHATLGYSPAAAGFFAFHDSKVALRLLLEQDEGAAITALDDSIRRYGIANKHPFSTAEECLRYARNAYDPQTGCLYLDNPQTGMIGGAILVEIPGEPLSVLALNGSMKKFSREFLTVTLQQAKHLVEESVRATP